MAEITIDRLMILMGSARKNRDECQELIHHYDGAIQVLQLLIDDLRAQTIKERAGQEYPAAVENGEEEPCPPPPEIDEVIIVETLEDAQALPKSPQREEPWRELQHIPNYAPKA
jgi:hypothetical protein